MGRKKDDPTIKPKPFKLAEHVDVVEREAEKFDIPAEKALAIAGDVDKEREAALQITQTRKESELREVFEEIYDQEVTTRQFCPVENCGTELDSIKHAIAHFRIHILYEADFRTQRAVANDIEERLFPAVEQEVTAAYTAEERTALMKTLREAKLLESDVEVVD
jgi:hypothetical protein